MYRKHIFTVKMTLWWNYPLIHELIHVWGYECVLLCTCGSGIVCLAGIFQRGELIKCACRCQWMPWGEAMAALQGPHFLPGEWWLMRRMAAKLRPPLPVVGPYLQNGLFKRPRCQRVKDGVKGTVDGEDKYDHPGANGTYGQTEEQREERGRNKSNYDAS